ncbi:hypothetical protein DVH24_040941 [Malus domestica]|uniref:Uncharacterized protein n=1 Tax=Malus domestica TaxID=3750 RepID=A0A498ICJ1_MALDO|nr:hypothetical protein DVH24_040941 [Malus domestica]
MILRKHNDVKKKPFHDESFIVGGHLLAHFDAFHFLNTEDSKLHKSHFLCSRTPRKRAPDARGFFASQFSGAFPPATTPSRSIYTSATSHLPLLPSVKPVIVALGGYKRLYRVYVRPILSRLSDSDMVRRVWTWDEVQLSLSLFCVDYYEVQLYRSKRVCVRHILSRLSDSDMVRRVWTLDEIQLSLSLFCVDYYKVQLYRV